MDDDKKETVDVPSTFSSIMALSNEAVCRRQMPRFQSLGSMSKDGDLKNFGHLYRMTSRSTEVFKDLFSVQSPSPSKRG